VILPGFGGQRVTNVAALNNARKYFLIEFRSLRFLPLLVHLSHRTAIDIDDVLAITRWATTIKAINYLD